MLAVVQLMVDIAVVVASTNLTVAYASTESWSSTLGTFAITKSSLAIISPVGGAFVALTGYSNVVAAQIDCRFAIFDSANNKVWEGSASDTVGLYYKTSSTVRTGGGYNILEPEYITNRGGYGTGGYGGAGTGLNYDIKQLYGGVGLNPNLNYSTTGLANTAEALSQASGVDINRAEFAGRGGLTADQEAALDRALTAADYATPSNWFSGLGNLGTMLGMGALGRGGGGGGGARVPGAAGGSFVPKGMVDYSGILNLLAPKTSTRTSLLG